MLPVPFLVIRDVIDLKIINFALANFLILSDNLVSILSIFHFISTLRETWIPPITSTRRRHNDVRLRGCVN